MSDIIRIAQFGLGPIGLESVKLVTTKSWARFVGAIDIDPAKVGEDIGELIGSRELRGVVVHSSAQDLLRSTKPDVVLHTTVSRFKDAFPQLEPFARGGISVVSSCEELVYPQLKEPELAAALNAICEESGACIVGTGVNPGFVMDVLALCLTGVSREVQGIRIQRVVDASTRREPLQRKIGSGLPPEEFERQFRDGQAGHAGLKESLALIAHCLNWKVTGISEACKAVVADRDIRTRFLEVKKGLTCGLHQYADGTVNGKTALSLDLKMYLDAPDPHDAIQIEGEPPLDMILNGGVAGDVATVAAVVNTACRIRNANPGLRLMTELSLPLKA